MSVPQTIGLPADPLQLRNILSKFGQGAFYLYNSTTQTIVFHASTFTKLTMDTTVVDVNSWVATSVYTPKQPGYYLLFAQGTIYNTGNEDWTDGSDYMYFGIRKNGATPTHLSLMGAKRNTFTYCCILEANGTTDYFDVGCRYHDGSGGTNQAVISFTTFGGVFVSYNNP